MHRWPTIRRVVLHAVTVGAPGLFVLVVLMLAGALQATAAAIALVAVLVLTAIVVWPYVAGLDNVRAAVDRLAVGEEPATPEAGPSLGLGQLWQAVLAVHRDRLAHAGEVERRLAAEAAILAALPGPLVLFDERRDVVRVNPAAASWLGAGHEGRDLAALIRHPTLLAAADAVLAGAEEQTVTFDDPAPPARTFVAHVKRLAATGTDGAAALLALQDVTAIRQAERVRADFVANVSHELRTPLSTLVGFIETLRGPARDDEEARTRFLAIMHEQANRMARLIEDLLSLSRIEQDEHTAPSGSADLAALARIVADTMELRAKARGMSIQVEVEGDPPPVQGDGDQITQVLQNLVDNAVKYGRRGTPVLVRVRRSARTLTGADRRPRAALSVSVSDRGEGIPREHLPRLTERFYRADAARSRALGGTGLGLAIVKHIVNRHRGHLEIDSAAGEGSTFTVHLPVASEAAVGEPAPGRDPGAAPPPRAA